MTGSIFGGTTDSAIFVLPAIPNIGSWGGHNSLHETLGDKASSKRSKLISKPRAIGISYYFVEVGHE